ncbi:MAG: rod shape-determining protein MreC, partial [Gemmatimonadales bacterium]|nr:rod shape-determining protein MreC [Gemmatimonadales bacterium]
MLRASERTFSRRDSVSFFICIGLSLLALFLPDSVSLGVAGSLRDSVLSPLVWLQSLAEEGRTSRSRFRAVTLERDSAAFAAQFLPAIEAENRQLRSLLSLRNRLTTPYIPGEVMHQSQATEGRLLLINAGRRDGVRPFDPVISPDGLVGVIWNAGEASAYVMTWTHPEFRVSAVTADGRLFGMVAPTTTTAASEATLEFRSTSYRDTLAAGTVVVASGLGGVYPKGVAIGTITVIAREQAGWERVYRLQAAANPSKVTHVLVLREPRALSVASAFPGESVLAVLRTDSLRRVRVADSLLRVRIADSVIRRLHDT